MSGVPRLAWIEPDDPPEAFPDPQAALRDPDGLLAAGGNLSAARLLYAYRHGIFPWYSPGQPILWWSPDPRAVLFPESLHISRSLRRTLRRRRYTVTLDQAFDETITQCATAARGRAEAGTWITPEMHAAYVGLHDQGVAHSVEVWMDGALAGGLYGIAIGHVFFGESMFSLRTDASKIALVWLVKQLVAWSYKLVDCQVASDHLRSLGSTSIPRSRFLALLEQYASEGNTQGGWRLDISPEF